MRDRIGANGYLAVYSIVAAVTLGYAIYSYIQADKFDFIWVAGPGLRGVTYLLMMVALIFLVGGFMVPNPTQVGQEKKLTESPRGVIRITRHPVQWAFILWAVGHIIANGDVAGLIFFSSIGLVSIFGMMSMDRRKASEEHFGAFAAQTSNIPFAAIFSGRTKAAFGEWVLPIVIGLVAWGALVWLHPVFTGVRAM